MKFPEQTDNIQWCLFHKDGGVPVLLFVFRVFQGIDGQAELAHGFEHINAHAVESRPGFEGIAAFTAGVAGAGFAQAAVAHGKSEVVAVAESLAFQMEGNLLGDVLVMAADDDAPGIAAEHFFILFHGGAAGTGRAGEALAPVVAAEHAFEQGAAVKANLGNMERGGADGTHVKGNFLQFFSVSGNFGHGGMPPLWSDHFDEHILLFVKFQLQKLFFFHLLEHV